MTLLHSDWAYAIILILSISGLLVIDYKWQLIIWRDVISRRAFLATLICGLVFFLIWDLVGIGLGIFYTNPRYTLGINLFTPNLPIEEIGFLTLLIYTILILLVGFTKRSEAVYKTKPKPKK